MYVYLCNVFYLYINIIIYSTLPRTNSFFLGLPERSCHYYFFFSILYNGVTFCRDLNLRTTDMRLWSLEVQNGTHWEAPHDPQKTLEKGSK